MHYGRALLVGSGWAGTLGGLALCVLIFLSAYLAFDDHGAGVKPRRDEIIRLPAVPEAEVPRVPLARPPSPPSGTEVGRGSPPVGQVVEDTGDTLGDAVDALSSLPPPGR